MSRFSAWLLALAIVCPGCSSPNAPEERIRPDDPQRRERLRRQLRGRLADYDTPLPAATTQQIERGASLYDALCRACHGPTGRGTGRSARMLVIRPPDLADPRTASFFSDRAKLRIITEGIEGSPMIGWKRMLDEQERLDVLHFMNSLIEERPDP